MGSGTTLFVAEKMKRNSIGIDIMPQYYEMVLKKIESTNYYLFDKRGQYVSNKSK
jgi:DNA modification methylase